MWDPPGPGLEPVSPALAGGFLTTAPPGKPLPILIPGSPVNLPGADIAKPVIILQLIRGWYNFMAFVL